MLMVMAASNGLAHEVYMTLADRSSWQNCFRAWYFNAETALGARNARFSSLGKAGAGAIQS